MRHAECSRARRHSKTADGTDEDRWVVPAGSEEMLIDLLSPLSSETAGVRILGVSVERSVIIVSLQAGGEPARLVLHHARQAPSVDMELLALEAAGMAAELHCIGCSKETLSALAEALTALDEPGWTQLWRERDTLRTTARPLSTPPEGHTALLPTAAALLLLPVVLLVWRARRPLLPLEASSPEEVESATGGARLRWYDLIGIAALSVALAWPIWHSPITDAGLFRLIDLIDWPFDCPGHPWLPFTLIRPFAALSLEPWVIRFPLLAILVAGTLFLSMVCACAGGRWAGLLAGVWMACEIPRQHGLFDISFWDLASFFVVAVLLWLLVVEREKHAPGPIFWALLVFILLGGLYSSWLFVVLAGIAVPALGLLSLRGRVSWLTFAAMAVLVGLMGARAVLAYVRVGQTPLGAQDWVVEHLLVHTPVGRNVWMIVPMVIGAAWLLYQCRPSSRHCASAVFSLLAAPAVIVSVYIVSGSRWVTGGYYLQIVSGPMLYVAAVGAGLIIASLARVVQGLLERLSLGASVLRWSGFASGLTGFLAIAALTVSAPHGAAMEDSDGLEHMLSFDRLARDTDVPILSNVGYLALHIGYTRALAGEAGGWSELRLVGERLVPFCDQRCSLETESLGTLERTDALARLVKTTEESVPRHYIVIAKSKRYDASECHARIIEGCRRLFEEAEVFQYFACDSDVLGLLASLEALGHRAD